MVLPPDYEQKSAADKMAVLWKNIKEQEFDPAAPDAPKPIDPDPWVSSNLLNPVFLHATFEHSSDELPKGRVRLIHTYGRCTLACVQAVGKLNCKSDFAKVMGATTLECLDKHRNGMLGWQCRKSGAAVLAEGRQKDAVHRHVCCHKHWARAAVPRPPERRVFHTWRRYQAAHRRSPGGFHYLLFCGRHTVFNVFFPIFVLI